MSNAEFERCGANGVRLFDVTDELRDDRPYVKGCHHGARHWHHVHWRLAGQAMCRVECRCGKVMAPDGRVGGGASDADWWREGVFA